MRNITVLLLLIAHYTAQTQNVVTRNDSIPVIHIADTLELAWASGLNSGQVSHIDFNKDGLMDLYVFEANNEYNPETGDKSYAFINQGGTGKVNYKFDPSYRGNFPNLEEYSLLIDYNCDNKPDIFTWHVLGRFKVYRNTSVGKNLSFQLEKKVLTTDTTGLPYNINYYHTGDIAWNYLDMPAIVDVDGDGDMDILSTATNGHFIEYNKNMSMEYYGNCDSLEFKLKNTCWGGVFEDTGAVYLDTCDVVNVANPESSVNNKVQKKPVNNKASSRHSSDAILALDLNGDGVMDLIEGDAGRNYLYQFTNDGTTTSSHIKSYKEYYPPVDTFNAVIYGLPFYLDLDNDSKKDLIVSVGMDKLEDVESLWFYKNTGTASVPKFTLQTKSFLQSEMIDVGTQSKPVFFDYNQDSLLDIVIGNYGYFQELGLIWSKSKYVSQLALYENTGTKTEPIYTLVDLNFANLDTIPLNLAANKPVLALHPTFGDLDGDGDEDMILGDSRGKIHYFENIPNGGKANFKLVSAEFLGIDVGIYSTPQLFDLDEDGKLDLIIGEELGNFNYYRNTTTSSLNFVLEDDSLGDINVRDNWDWVGFSTPFFYRDSEGVTKLIAGSKSGFFSFYDSIIVGDTISSKFNRLEKRYQDLWDGIFSTINGADIDNDGQLDFILGNQSGGVTLYTSLDSIYDPDAIEEYNPRNTEVDVFPNPAKDELTIRVKCNCTDQFVYSIYTVLGNHVMDFNGKSEVTFSIKDLKAGLYVVSGINKNRSIRITERFIKIE